MLPKSTPPLTPCTFLESIGVTDLNKVSSQTYESDVQFDKRIMTYADRTTLYFDDPDVGRRIVLRIQVQSKKRGQTGKVLVPDSFCSARVTQLDGYDAQANMWGSVSQHSSCIEAPAALLWETHKQLEALRSQMERNSPYIWYRSNS